MLHLVSFTLCTSGVFGTGVLIPSNIFILLLMSDLIFLLIFSSTSVLTFSNDYVFIVEFTVVKGY